MPHCIIEYSRNLESDIEHLSQTLHQDLIEMGHFTPAAIKTRAIPFDHYQVGEQGSSASFIHITLYLLEGRPEDLRATIARSLFERSKTKVPSCNSVSVDIRQMSANIYQK